MKKAITSAAISVLSASLLAPVAMAADNNYGIVYSGGTELTENININDGDEELAKSLTGIILTRGETSFGGNWQSGFYATSDNQGNPVCLPAKYVLVTSGGTTGKLSFSTSNETGYSLNIDINNISAEFSGVQAIPITVIKGTSAIHVGEVTYADSQCETRVKDGDGNDAKLEIANSGKVFVEMDAKLYKGNNKQFVGDGVYFGFEDIDAAQSYKILNEDSKLEAEKMISPNKENIKDGYHDGLENKFVSNGNYIYSMYTSSGDYIQNQKAHRLMTPITKATLEDGLDFVFGFAKGAGSSILFYAQQFKVVYESGDNGEITGITDEDIIKSDSPSGTSVESDDGYDFSYWVADKDVVLADGTEIKKGEEISGEQIKEIVVSEDLTFTAIYEKTPVVPDTGAIVEEEANGTVITASISGVVALAMALFFLPRLNHKKMDFMRK